MSETRLTEAEVFAALREVIDPEMGIDIVALGLIYDVRIHHRRVSVTMTLTMRGCPMHNSLVHGVRLVLWNLETVEDVDVELVWDPPWSPARMSPQALARLK